METTATDTHGNHPHPQIAQLNISPTLKPNATLSADLGPATVSILASPRHGVLRLQGSSPACHWYLRRISGCSVDDYML